MSKVLLGGIVLVVIFGVYQLLSNQDGAVINPPEIVRASIFPLATAQSSVKPGTTNPPTAKQTTPSTQTTTTGNVLIAVPFTSQAPFGEWSDPRQEDACEEASALMAVHWAKNEPITGKQAAKDEILAISKFEVDTYNDYHDTSAQDTVDRIIKGYYHYNNVEVLKVGSIQDLVNQLGQGHIIIVPANGQVLDQPNFTQPGPERHMLLIKGYDAKSGQFITNDPGIRQGENWKYKQDNLFSAIRNYTTGIHAPIVGDEKVMIVVKR